MPSPEIKLVAIPAGEFAMGSPHDAPDREHDEAPRIVRIPRPFHMSATEVTQAQWTAVMGKRQCAFEGDDRPVESVSWKDAVAFCERLSKLENRTYRLPSEAEWEYACRAGSTPAQASDLSEHAWFAGNADDASHPVAGRKPNAWGLYDMHGNVAEWCADAHDTSATRPASGDAQAETPAPRVVRGGSFASSARGCRPAARSSLPESYALKFVGFRVVAEPAP